MKRNKLTTRVRIIGTACLVNCSKDAARAYVFLSI